MRVKFRFIGEMVVEGEDWKEVCDNYYQAIRDAKSNCQELSFDKTIGVINDEEWEDLWDEYWKSDWCCE